MSGAAAYSLASLKNFVRRGLPHEENGVVNMEVVDLGVYRTVDFRGSASAIDTEDQGCVRGDGQLQEYWGQAPGK